MNEICSVTQRWIDRVMVDSSGARLWLYPVCLVLALLLAALPSYAVQIICGVDLQIYTDQGGNEPVTENMEDEHGIGVLVSSDDAPKLYRIDAVVPEGLDAGTMAVLEGDIPEDFGLELYSDASGNTPVYLPQEWDASTTPVKTFYLRAFWATAKPTLTFGLKEPGESDAKIYDIAKVYGTCVICEVDPEGNCVNSEAKLNSLSYKLGLGTTNTGNSAGYLHIYSKYPDVSLCTPAALTVDAQCGVKVYRSNGVITSVVTPKYLVEVTDETATSYKLKVYNGKTTSYPVLKTVTISSTDVNQLDITESDGGSKAWQFEWSDESQSWTLKEGFNDGQTVSMMQKTERQEITVNTLEYIEKVTIWQIVSGGDDVMLSQHSETYHLYPWGKELIKRESGSVGNMSIEVWFYYDDESDGNDYGRLKSYQTNSGYWQWYDYNDSGELVKKIEQYGDSDYVDPPVEASNLVTTYATTTLPLIHPERGTVADCELKTETMIDRGTNENIQYRIKWGGTVTKGGVTCKETWSVSAGTSSSAWHDYTNNHFYRTWRIAGDQAYAHKTKQTLSQDGQMSIYDYTSPTVTTVSSGFPDSPTSAIPQIIYGSRTTTVLDNNGRAIKIYSEQIDNTTDGWFGVSLVTNKDDTTDAGTRITSYYYGQDAEDEYALEDSGDIAYTTKVNRDCCNVQWETDKYGITTHYVYDGLGRTIETTRSFVVNEALETSYTFEGSKTEYGVDATDGGHVVTTFRLVTASNQASSDDYWEETQTTMYDLAGRVREVIDAAGRSTYYTYSTVTDNNVTYNETRVYPHDTTLGPIQVTWTDSHGRIYRSFTASTDEIWSDAPQGDETLTKESLTEFAYDGLGRQTSVRTYHDIAAESYYESFTEYDFLGRAFRKTDEIGNVTEIRYDSQGRPTEYLQGNSPYDLYVISRIWYDLDYDRSGNDFRPYSTRKSRLVLDASSYTYTELTRDRSKSGVISWAKPDIGVWTKQETDEQGRVISSSTYINGSTAESMKQTHLANIYDPDVGRLIEERSYAVQNDGSLGNYIVSTYDYDRAGRRIKTKSSGKAFTKTAYDRRGRVARTATGSEEGVTGPIAEAGDTIGLTEFDGDILLTETVYTYDDDTDQVIRTTKYERRHKAASSGLLSDISAETRVTYIATWYDGAGRVEYIASYGDGGGSAPTYTYPPISSTDVLVTHMEYDNAGRLDKVTDIDGKITKTFCDDLGRSIYVVENYSSWTNEPDAVPPSNIKSDVNRVTHYEYNAASQIIKQTAVDPNHDGNDTDKQTTEYTYGPNSAYRNDLLTKITYPDNESSSDVVEMTYYADGSLNTRKDQRGTELTYTYYDNGHRKSQYISTQGNDTDITVQSITYAYDDNERLYKVTSHGNPTTDPADTSSVVNQVVYLYNNFGQLEYEFQQHGAAAETDLQNPDVSPYIQYTYGNLLTTGGRLISITYPNGRVIHRLYDGHDGDGNHSSIDNAIGRANRLSEDAAGTSPIVEYTYLGSDRMVRKDYPGPYMRLDYINESGEGGTVNDYDASIDRFWRVVRHQWETYDGNGAHDINKFQVLYGYDLAGNRRYADRQVYKSHSQYYTYDELHRLTDYQAGKMSYDENSDPSGIESYWMLDRRGYSLDQVGNQRGVTTPEATDYYKHAIDDGGANEYTTHEVKSSLTAATQLDNFTDETTVEGPNPDWVQVGDDDEYDVDTSTNVLRVTSIADDGDDDPGACAVLLKGEAVGPFRAKFSVAFPTGATTGQAGLVIGYDEDNPGDYWIYVADIGAQQIQLIKIKDGVKQSPALATYNKTITAGTSNPNTIFLGSKRNTTNTTYGTDFEFEDGFPSGKIGLWTDKQYVEFGYVEFYKDAPATELAGHWLNPGFGKVYDAGSGDGRLRIQSTVPSTLDPILLDGIRAQKFQATFCMRRVSDPVSHTNAWFVFNASSTDEYFAVHLSHNNTKTLPVVCEVTDGGTRSLVSSTYTDATSMPTLSQYDELWVRVKSDGTTLSIKCNTSNNFTGVGDCYRTTGTIDLTRPGGLFGFMSASYSVDIDDLTIETDHDGDTTYTTEYVDHFDIDTGYTVQELDYDDAGNLVYDGRHKFTYDAWNRLVTIENAYPDSSQNEGYNTGSTVGEMSYDGTGRRTIKAVSHSADLNGTYHYYYKVRSIVQIDNGSGQMLKQYVWGLKYIDELCQIGMNIDPANADTVQYSENIAERFFYALQDANYNVLGVIGASGYLAERYEYTPYGQRTVYSHAVLLADIDGNGFNGITDLDQILGNWNQGTESAQVGDLDGDGYVGLDDLEVRNADANVGVPANDPMVSYPRWHSLRNLKSSSAIGSNPGIPLCEVGHQGLFHDEEFGAKGGLIHNRARVLDPRFGRFMQRDPLGYIDGMSVYTYYAGMHGGVDPTGLLDAGWAEDLGSHNNDWDAMQKAWAKTRIAKDPHKFVRKGRELILAIDEDTGFVQVGVAAWGMHRTWNGPDHSKNWLSDKAQDAGYIFYPSLFDPCYLTPDKLERIANVTIPGINIAMHDAAAIRQLENLVMAGEFAGGFIPGFSIANEAYQGNWSGAGKEAAIEVLVTLGTLGTGKLATGTGKAILRTASRHADECGLVGRLSRQTLRMANKTDDALLIGLRKGHCFTAGTEILTERGYVPIEQVRVGQKVLTPRTHQQQNHDQGDGESDDDDPDPDGWRLVSFQIQDRLVDGTPNDVRIQALVPQRTVASWEAGPGDLVTLPADLAELGISGFAEVVSIEPCPVFDRGNGQLVLATINRLSDDVYALILADTSGETETIEVTGSHPFMSQSRGWVRADALQVDEQVRTADGQALVISRIPLPGLHRVFNITVDREHVYYAGQTSVLVHNDCQFEKVYHGTDSNSARSIETKGLNKKDWNEAAGGSGVDSKGFSVTTDKDTAQAWAEVRARERGGEPVVLEANANDLPLKEGESGMWTDPSEKYISPEDFDNVPPGTFKPTD